MTNVVNNPSTVNIFLFIVSFLLTVLIIIVAFVGNGFSKKLESVFKEFKLYRTKEICVLKHEMESERNAEIKKDVNNLGKKVSVLNEKSS